MLVSRPALSTLANRRSSMWNHAWPSGPTALPRIVSSSPVVTNRPPGAALPTTSAVTAVDRHPRAAVRPGDQLLDRRAQPDVRDVGRAGRRSEQRSNYTRDS